MAIDHRPAHVRRAHQPDALGPVAHRVPAPGGGDIDTAQALGRAIAGQGPTLLDVELDRSFKPA